MSSHPRTPRRPGRAGRASRIMLAIVLLLARGASGQEPDQLARQANNLFNAGQYEHAAKLYEQIVTDYPTSPLRSRAELQAGYALYLTGEYERALDYLRRTQEATATEGIRRQGLLLIPQVLSAAADDAGSDEVRDERLERAVEAFGEYIERHPRTPDVETALYGRALARYRLGEYEEAAEDLDLAISRFPDSETVTDSEYLLALTRAAQGAELVEAAGGSLTPEARGLFERAAGRFREIIDGGANIALANDARFQLGEVYYRMAAAMPEDEAGPMFQRAVRSFREVRPRDEMVAAQRQVIDGLLERRRAALQRGDTDSLPAIQRLQDRAAARLAAIEGRPDQTLDAAIRAGQVYFREGRHNAARVLLGHMRPFAATEEQRQSILYFLTMAAIQQGDVPKAVELYGQFRDRHAGAPVAANLPLAMGNLFLAQGDPGAAMEYLDEQIRMYPDAGGFLDMAVIQKASAESILGKHEQAVATFRGYLESKPDGPAEVRAQATFGLAGAHRDMGEWERAVETYRRVREEFPERTDLAETSALWIGYCLTQMGRHEEAMPLLAAFLENNPESPLAATALFTLGQSQVATGETEEALANFRRVATEHPDDPAASFAYFQIANIHMVAEDYDAMVAVLSEFLEKHPDDPKVYTAVDTLAGDAINRGEPARAAALYEDFARDYPGAAEAPSALLRASNIWRDAANALGRYTALDAEQRARWESAVESSIAAAERLAMDYGTSDELALGMKSLLESQRLRLDARLIDEDGMIAYFETLAGRVAEIPQARAKVLFTLADYKYESDPERAIGTMREAYDPEMVFDPDMLDTYGLALIEQGELDAARAVFEKIATDFPLPEGVSPQAAPAEAQTAQAVALFGLGRVAQESGDDARATELFSQLLETYPWSPKNLEASLAVARSEFSAGDLDAALEKIIPVIRARTATTRLRAEAMLLGGDIQRALYEREQDEERKDEYLRSAIDYYIKIARFYGGVQAVAAEGLWRGARLLEAQAARLDDPEKRARQLGIARRSYASLAEDYPDSPHAQQAADKAAGLAPAP